MDTRKLPRRRTRDGKQEARTAAKAAIDTAHQIGATQLAKEPTATLGFLEVSLGDHAAALRALQPLLDAFDPYWDRDRGLAITFRTR